MTQNIQKVFGTNTSAFELLVIKRKIMGPCWIQIKDPKFDNLGVIRLFSLPSHFLTAFFIDILV